MSFASIRKKLLSLCSPPQARDPRHRLGARGERAAARHLRKLRYRIVARNYRCESGEIDLICTDDDTIVFVEVKTRSSDDAQDPREAIRPSQWRRVHSAARYFLMERSAQNQPCRFDVVTVVWPARGSPQIEHFPDAFQPGATR